MYAQCPKCNAIFRIATQDLTRAEGYVRCGECDEVFNAMDALRALRPEDTGETSLSRRASHGRRKNDEAPTVAPVPDVQLDAFAHDTDIPSALSDDLAASQTPQAEHLIRNTLLWAGGSLLLIALLGTQYSINHRYTLYQHPSLQPLLQTLCGLAACDTPARKDTSRIELVNRNIYSHPNAQGALMITATVVNNAPYAQPYPLIGIRMSNVQGETIARRRFSPEQYLPNPEQAHNMMEPGTPVFISLEVQDPGSSALAFEFEFL